jgi:hypothetical protein
MAKAKRTTDESEDSSLRMTFGILTRRTGPSGRRAEGLTHLQRPLPLDRSSYQHRSARSLAQLVIPPFPVPRHPIGLLRVLCTRKPDLDVHVVPGIFRGIEWSRSLSGKVRVFELLLQLQSEKYK